MIFIMMNVAFLAIVAALMVHYFMKERRPMAPIIYLEGNIAAGKSTLAANLKRLELFPVLDEPVKDWQDVEGHNLLELLYTDRATWSYPFQVLALDTLGRRQTSLLANHPEGLTVLERSPQCSLRVFAQALAEMNAIGREHMAILRILRDAVAPPTQRPIHYIYVRTPPAIAYQRLNHRGRTEEVGVTVEYLTLLHDLTDAWLLQEEANPVHVLDGTLTPAQLLAAALDIIQNLRDDVTPAQEPQPIREE
ncbi:deoxynucleoside kinase-like [Thrips palmi]|uniref:Deoxynucleoside kinase-like n=1 Tax=Thrips palmi TaxID=161013 RepID=A0A6P8ZK16_THRPL|nr:deoxynucleoside kinase-like [Thrips palmi]